jgi:hypothetical protein
MESFLKDWSHDDDPRLIRPFDGLPARRALADTSHWLTPRLTWLCMDLRCRLSHYGQTAAQIAVANTSGNTDAPAPPHRRRDRSAEVHIRLPTRPFD